MIFQIVLHPYPKIQTSVMKKSIQSLEQFIRKDLEGFAEKYDAAFHSLIDWSKPAKFISDKINSDILPEHLRCTEDQLQYLISAFNLAGEPVIFSLSVVITEDRQDFVVEFSEPRIYNPSMNPSQDKMESADLEEEELTEEQKESLEKAQRFFDNLKVLTAKIKESKKRKKPDSSKCNSCGRKDLPLTTSVNGVSGEIKYYCTLCLSRLRNDMTKERSLSDVESEIKKMETMASSLEEMINSHEMPEVPEGLSMFAFTPISLYKSMQAALADLKSEKMEILAKMDTEARIKRELKEALGREDYKKAEKLKGRLEQLQKGSGKK